jgi:hypothetical protein
MNSTKKGGKVMCVVVPLSSAGMLRDTIFATQLLDSPIPVGLPSKVLADNMLGRRFCITQNYN